MSCDRFILEELLFRTFCFPSVGEFQVSWHETNIHFSVCHLFLCAIFAIFTHQSGGCWFICYCNGFFDCFISILCLLLTLLKVILNSNVALSRFVNWLCFCNQDSGSFMFWVPKQPKEWRLLSFLRDSLVISIAFEWIWFWKNVQWQVNITKITAGHLATKGLLVFTKSIPFCITNFVVSKYPKMDRWNNWPFYKSLSLSFCSIKTQGINSSHSKNIMIKFKWK